MAKIKKAFDKELMYKKIMPTNFKKEPDIKINIEEEYNKEEKNKKENIINEKDGSIFRNKEINLKKGEKSDVILYNVMEKLVIDKLDITLKKMNCCRCDRCKEDIIAIALNNLKPMYIVASKDEIENKILELDNLGLEVTTSVLKAVLAVRKNPRH